MRNKINYSNFSRRETQVIKYVSKGFSNKEIASVLGLSENTVKEYLGNVFRKTGVNNRTALVVKTLFRKKYYKKTEK